MAKRLSQEEFLSRAKKIWNNQWDYSKTIYSGSLSMLEITCYRHGDFQANARQHLLGKSSCPQCMKENRSITLEEVLKKAEDKFKQKYTYNQTWEKGVIEFTCKIHGIQRQLWFNHLKGKGCAPCSYNDSRNTEESIKNTLKELFNEQYSLVPDSYKNNSTPMEITCADHGTQKGYFSNLQKGQKLLCCALASKQSKLESEILKELQIQTRVETNNRTALGGKELDIFIPSKNKAIEINGCFWHGEEFLKTRNTTPKKQHQIKLDLADAAKIDLIFIWECDWLHRKNEVLDRIKTWLNFGAKAPILLKLEDLNCLKSNDIDTTEKEND